MNDFGGPDQPLKSTYVGVPEPMLTVRARKTPDCPAVFAVASASSRPISGGVVLCSQRAFCRMATVIGGQFAVGERASARHTQASMARYLPYPKGTCTQSTRALMRALRSWLAALLTCAHR